MRTKQSVGFPKAAASGAGALTIVLGLLPLVGRIPKVTGALFTASAFVAIPMLCR